MIEVQCPCAASRERATVPIAGELDNIRERDQIASISNGSFAAAPPSAEVLFTTVYQTSFILRSRSACVSFCPAHLETYGQCRNRLFHGIACWMPSPRNCRVAYSPKRATCRLRRIRSCFSLEMQATAFTRIEDGLLKVSVSASGGGERILAILGGGSIVGELSMIDGAPRSASVSALRDSKPRFVSRAAFEAFGRTNPEVHRQVMILLARRLRDTNDALAATSFLPVKGRVARALLNLAEGFGRDVGGGRIVLRQKVTQSDLAAMAGIARENVSRILKEWMDRSLVSRLAGYYCLENKAAVEREADQEADL